MSKTADLLIRLSRDPEPSGYARLRMFCDQVEAGQVPDGELLQEVAAAFRAMLAEDGLDKQRRAFTKAMQMHRRKGLKAPTGADHGRELAAAIELQLASPEKGSRIDVVEDVAGRYGVDASTVGKWEKKHRVDAEYFADWIRDIQARRQD